MTLFWIIIIPIVAVVAAMTLFDLFRHHLGGWPTAGWALLIVLLPFIGALVYWIARKPMRGDAEGAYLAEADARAQRQRHPVDRSGF